jgi:polyhydroxybutyrate depolymerase
VKFVGPAGSALTDSNLFTLNGSSSDHQVVESQAQTKALAQRLSQQAFAGDSLSVKDSTATQPAASNDSGTNKVDQIVSLFERLPGSFELSKDQLTLVLKQAKLDQDPQIKAILSGVTKLVKNGNHLELQRDSATHIPLNEDIVKGLLSIKSVDLDSLKFDVNFKSEPKQVSNVSGLNLTFSAFGSDSSVAIQEAKLSHDQAGNTVITGMVENPIPAAARTVLDIGDRIPVTIKLTPHGDFVAPRASTVIQDAANTTGTSLPGLVLHDELTDAAEVAQFAEKYPKWMGDTVSPILTGLEKVIEDNQEKAAQDKHPQPGPPKSAERILPAADKAPATATQAESFAKPSTDNRSGVTGPGEYDKTIKVDGNDRHYILHVPPAYDVSKPMPMILALHGMGGSAASFEQRTRLNDIADREGFIVIYPDSTDWFNQKDWKTWDTGDGIIPPGKHVDDTKFLRRVIDDTQKDLNVDDKRIYMAGVSNGGMMTMHAAGALSDKLAAVAVVSGAMSGREQSPTQPLSVINIHGTNDSVIPINGIEAVPDSLTLLGIPTFKPNCYIPTYWNIKDGITGAPTTEKIGNETRQHYYNPKTGAEVEQIVVAGGEHVPSNIQPTMETVVRFFENHPKIAATSDNVPPPNNPPVDMHKPVDPVARLIADVKKRGITGIEADVDRALAAVPALSDGTISPADLYNKVDATLHQNFNDPVSSFIKSTESLSKSGEHIELKRSNTASIPLNFEVPGTHGILNLKDLQVGTTSFDLRNRNGLFSIDNLRGLSIKSSILGQDITSSINQVTESKAIDGNHIYSVKVSHPLPSIARFILMQPSDISVKVELDSQGNPKVINQNEIMDDALGRNPLVRGVIDEGTDITRAVTNPSLSSVGNALKDVAITGSATLLGGRLGFALAPAIVHELDS